MSDTGVVSDISPTGFTMATGSHVSLSAEINITDEINVMRFNYEFLAESNGVLSVLYDDNLMFLADERYSPGIEDTDWLWLVGDLSPGNHELRFLLEPLSDMQSVLKILNIEFGQFRIIPEPGTLVMFGLLVIGLSRNCTLQSAWNRRCQGT